MFINISQGPLRTLSNFQRALGRCRRLFCPIDSGRATRPPTIQRFIRYLQWVSVSA
ncbi:hypothetical protein PHLCEN_2v12026 [Hermanssonia centrifuga]|uniref:Uncharacterized protein n=1 Tax=Hermanssonia centrifuga TaxID=98765 RepID=A0A2R6NII2_9APHY|nr:hypothetical protein PHLCEN_2v12026 [Hermanssonia centrifuga]